jgi:transcriptional regulator with XRE-family HTH domain/dienelactone hydrolase
MRSAVSGPHGDWYAVSEFSDELRRLLGERGMSVRECARKVPCDSGYVSKLAGGIKRPSPEMAERFDAVLGASGALAALACPCGSTPGMLHDQTPLSALLPLSFRSKQGDQPMLTVGFGATGIMAPAFKHVDPELIPYFQQQIEGHYRADMLLGPRALISTVTAQCKLIGQLTDSADVPTRQRMAVVGTSFASFAAWLYLDAGDIAASLQWHDVAQEMAHRSRDREAVACALVDRAMARTDQGMGAAVMDLCDSALMDAGHLSPELHVFALQQKAHGASIIGDRRQVDALLDAAGPFVDQVDVEVWGVPCLRTPHYVEVNRATCYGRLGLAKEALGIWQQIIPAAPSTARRDVGVWVARQAALAASLREPEWTVELARQAVKVALETGSARVRRELAAANVTMAPWQAEPVGRDFAEVLAPISEGI